MRTHLYFTHVAVHILHNLRGQVLQHLALGAPQHKGHHLKKKKKEEQRGEYMLLIVVGVLTYFTVYCSYLFTCCWAFFKGVPCSQRYGCGLLYILLYDASKSHVPEAPLSLPSTTYHAGYSSRGTVDCKSVIHYIHDTICWALEKPAKQL